MMGVAEMARESDERNMWRAAELIRQAQRELRMTYGRDPVAGWQVLDWSARLTAIIAELEIEIAKG